MPCSNCGAANGDDATFCASCGAALGGDASGHAAHELAGRWSRLGAKTIDYLVLLVPFVAFFVLLAAGVEGLAALVPLAGFVAIGVLQVVWLTKDGQTIGKRLSIRG